MSYIEIIGLSKEIGGKKIVSDANLRFEKGKAYGIVGANGSGKTVLMKMLLGLVTPNEGEIKVNGVSVVSGKKFPVYCGVMIENNQLWPEFSAFENLKYLADINKKISNEQIRDAIKKVGLDPKSKKAFSKFSLGMKQRLSLAQAIMEEPDILILDEPTNSLDECGIELMRGLIKQEKERGCTIIVSSHSPEFFDDIWDEQISVSNGVFTQPGGGKSL